jgi:hypothetical protein
LAPYLRKRFDIKYPHTAFTTYIDTIYLCLFFIHETDFNLGVITSKLDILRLAKLINVILLVIIEIIRK